MIWEAGPACRPGRPTRFCFQGPRPAPPIRAGMVPEAPAKNNLASGRAGRHRGPRPPPYIYIYIYIYMAVSILFVVWKPSPLEGFDIWLV